MFWIESYYCAGSSKHYRYPFISHCIYLHYSARNHYFYHEINVCSVLHAVHYSHTPTMVLMLVSKQQIHDFFSAASKEKYQKCNSPSGQSPFFSSGQSNEIKLLVRCNQVTRIMTGWLSICPFVVTFLSCHKD